MAITSRNIRNILIYYYAALQSLHLLALLRAGREYFMSGTIGFPAAPATAWSPDAIPFLVGTAVLDLSMIPLSWILVWCLKKQHPRERIIEAVALTGSLYSAGLFFLGTWPSGAWQAHPAAYGLLAFLFSPVILLVILEIYWRKKP